MIWFYAFWLLGSVASMCFSGFWSSNRAVFDKLQSRFSDPTPNGFNMLCLSLCWPGHFAMAYFWWRRQKDLAMDHGPFTVLDIPHSVVAKSQAGSGFN